MWPRGAACGASILLLLLPSGAPPARSADRGVAISHDGVGCLVAGEHPELSARLTPSARVARARAFFRAEGTPHWYFVEMPVQGDVYLALLPRPKRGIGHVNYYLEVVDRELSATRTAEYAPVVVGTRSECPSKVAAATLSAAVISLGQAPGAPPVPAGFEATGIAAAPAGSAAASTAVASAAGGGALKVVLIGAGVAAAAGAVVVAKGGGGGGSSSRSDGSSNSTPSSPGATPSPAPSPVLWSVHLGTAGNGLDVSACGANVAGGFCGQGLNVDPSGAFREVWSQSTPVVRVEGVMTATAVSATLTCTNTSATGTMSATANGTEYSGTATLSGRTVPVRILKGAVPCN